ncbi:MAG: Hsp20/alpha crystallin family protein [Bdellovibrionales bacterium]
MNSRIKTPLIFGLGLVVGSGLAVGAQTAIAKRHTNIVKAAQAAPSEPRLKRNQPVDPFEQAFSQFDQALADQRKAMALMFSRSLPYLENSSGDAGQVEQNENEFVLKIPISNPQHKIEVQAKDGFLTVSELGKSESENSAESFRSVQSYSVDPEYDVSRMTQNMEGQTLVIKIPRGSVS